jgi:hypothetical protein
MKNEAAAALGRMGKGVRKTLTDAERKRRSERMRQLNAQRVAVQFSDTSFEVPVLTPTNNKPIV